MLKQLTALAAAGLIASSVYAGSSYSFTGITHNNAGDTAIGEAQLSVEVKSTSGLAEFVFRNSGPEASSMVQLYWEDKTGVLSSLQSWSTTTPDLVDFSGGSANPGHLPGSNPKINDYSIQAASQGGKQANGVGPGETVTTTTPGKSAFLPDFDPYQSGVVDWFFNNGQGVWIDGIPSIGQTSEFTPTIENYNTLESYIQLGIDSCNEEVLSSTDATCSLQEYLKGESTTTLLQEDVSIFFSYSDSFQDIIDAIDRGDLTVGTHVQGFNSGGSESFVTSVVPSPSAAPMSLIALGGLAMRRRRAA